MRKILCALCILLSAPLYAIEDDYIESFCLAFGKIEHAFNEYRYRPAADTADVAGEALTAMTRQYRTLLKIYDEASFKYRHRVEFDTIFRPRYTEVFNRVEVMLEYDDSLQAMKKMVQAMVNMEREGFPKNYEGVEQVTGRLQFQQHYPLSFFYSIEGFVLHHQLMSLEAYLYRRYFEPAIRQVEKGSPLTPEQAEDLKKRTERTHCRPCRQKAVPVLLDFYK